MSKEAYEHQEQAFERKFISEQEREFHVIARRDKLFGEWLAELLGYSGDAAHAYVRAVVASNFEKPGDDDILAKVRADLAAAKIDGGDLVRKLGDLRIVASGQIDGESKA